MSDELAKKGGSGWGSNPPRPAKRPAAGVEDREALRDLTTPGDKDTRRRRDWQDENIDP